MRRMYIAFAAFPILLILFVVVGGWLYLRSSLPKTSGAIHVAGIAGPVEIVRDGDGVPHIFAESDYDAMFGLGYVHAQDRMWQMEFNRRIASGRLSEILGESTLETDKFLRTLGVYRAAEDALPHLNQDAIDLLEGYAAGVNAWLEEGHRLPIEFQILRVDPEPWSLVDSIAWSKMLAWDLCDDYEDELLRESLMQAVGPERAAQIFSLETLNGEEERVARELSPSTVQGLLQIDSQLQRVYQLNGPDEGSNAWVVAGRHTHSGKPMLANDPHLGTSIPSIWYLAEVQGDRLHVTGATLPGLPAVVAGHNEEVAWGVTNAKADVQDLYIERINPKNPNQVEINGEWVDMQIDEELIYVKGEDQPLRWAARSTRHGPLISDVKDTTTPLALRWTALDADDTTFNAFTGINYAERASAGGSEQSACSA